MNVDLAVLAGAGEGMMNCLELDQPRESDAAPLIDTTVLVREMVSRWFAL